MATVAGGWRATEKVCVVRLEWKREAKCCAVPPMPGVQKQNQHFICIYEHICTCIQIMHIDR